MRTTGAVTLWRRVLTTNDPGTITCVQALLKKAKMHVRTIPSEHHDGAVDIQVGESSLRDARWLLMDANIL